MNKRNYSLARGLIAAAVLLTGLILALAACSDDVPDDIEGKRVEFAENADGIRAAQTDYVEAFQTPPATRQQSAEADSPTPTLTPTPEATLGEAEALQIALTERAQTPSPTPTPTFTPTPIPEPASARFRVGDRVLLPAEPGRAFFNLTRHPEPLQDTLANAESLCSPETAATITQVGGDQDGNAYYLVECDNIQGWAAEERLLGPLGLEPGDLAVALGSAADPARVEMLDENFQAMPPLPLPGTACAPDTIVRVDESRVAGETIRAVDPDGDGVREVYYRVTCPVPNSTPLAGWIGAADLFGPVPVQAGDRALAVIPPDTDEEAPYPLANDPALVTEENASGACAAGDVLTVEEASLVGEMVYYRVMCGEVTGWVDQTRLAGPLLYDPGMSTVIVVSSEPVLVRDLPSDVRDVIREDGETEEEAEEVDVFEEEIEAINRTIEMVPLLVLADRPGPAIAEGDDANAVGGCTPGAIAAIEDVAAPDGIYYRVTCAGCPLDQARLEVTGQEQVESVCPAVESISGWVPQEPLKGPLAFVPGDRALVKSDSRAVEIDEDGTEWARIPATTTGAMALGEFSEFSGRCPLADGVTITGVQIEKQKTRDAYDFYYAVECTTGAQESVTGFLMARDLVSE